MTRIKNFIRHFQKLPAQGRKRKKIGMQRFKTSLALIIVFLLFNTCNLIPFPNIQVPIFINPMKYLPTLRFDGPDWGDTGEKNFPMTYKFNTTQDGNGDGVIDEDDALENLVKFSIGDSIYGTGRTGLPNRGPNDQRLAIYFHLAQVDSYLVYEYWLYYADNDWINHHEHDWEFYFVYELNDEPEYIKMNSHDIFTTYNWDDIQKDEGFPVMDVDGGGHAMNPGEDEDGVKIRYFGEIISNGARLDAGAGDTIPWIIYSNVPNAISAQTFVQQPDTFNYGDPEYWFLANPDEYGDRRAAPWNRPQWDVPPAP